MVACGIRLTTEFYACIKSLRTRIHIWGIAQFGSHTNPCFNRHERQIGQVLWASIFLFQASNNVDVLELGLELQRKVLWCSPGDLPTKTTVKRFPKEIMINSSENTKQKTNCNA